MPWRVPIVCSEEIYRLRDVGYMLITIDDRLHWRELFDPGINASGTIRAKQQSIFDHQAGILDGSRRCVADKALPFDEVATRKARDLTKVFRLFDAGQLEPLLEDGEVVHLGALLDRARLVLKLGCKSVTNISLICALHCRLEWNVDECSPAVR